MELTTRTTSNVASISHNEFLVDAGGFSIGVFTRITTSDPPDTRIFVLKNIFRVSQKHWGIFLDGVFDPTPQFAQQSRPIIVDNQFELEEGRAVVAIGVSDGLISGNSFRGSNENSVVSVSEGGKFILNDQSCGLGGQIPYNWYIGNNDFSEFATPDGAAIGLGCVAQTLVGPEQNTRVKNRSPSYIDNIFLDTWKDCR